VKLISQIHYRDYTEHRQCSVYLDTSRESTFIGDSHPKFENKQILKRSKNIFSLVVCTISSKWVSSDMMLLALEKIKKYKVENEK